MVPPPVVPPPSRNLRSIATVSLSGTLADKLEAAARVGFDPPLPPAAPPPDPAADPGRVGARDA